MKLSWYLIPMLCWSTPVLPTLVMFDPLSLQHSKPQKETTLTDHISDLPVPHFNYQIYFGHTQKRSFTLFHIIASIDTKCTWYKYLHQWWKYHDNQSHTILAITYDIASMILFQIQLRSRSSHNEEGSNIPLQPGSTNIIISTFYNIIIFITHTVIANWWLTTDSSITEIYTVRLWLPILSTRCHNGRTTCHVNISFLNSWMFFATSFACRTKDRGSVWRRKGRSIWSYILLFDGHVCESEINSFWI